LGQRVAAPATEYGRQYFPHDFLPLELAAGASNALASQRLPWAAPGD